MSDTMSRLTPPPFDMSQPFQVSPPPPPPRDSQGTKWLVPLSIVLGIAISVGTIVSVIGTAFFVGRAEYTSQSLEYARDRVAATEALKRIDDTLARQEAAINKLADVVESLKASDKRRR